MSERLSAVSCAPKPCDKESARFEPIWSRIVLLIPSMVMFDLSNNDCKPLGGSTRAAAASLPAFQLAHGSPTPPLNWSSPSTVPKAQPLPYTCARASLKAPLLKDTLRFNHLRAESV